MVEAFCVIAASRRLGVAEFGPVGLAQVGKKVYDLRGNGVLGAAGQPPAGLDACRMVIASSSEPASEQASRDVTDSLPFIPRVGRGHEHATRPYMT